MKHDPIRNGKRKSVNLSMDSGIIAAARSEGVNLSQISEAAVEKETKRQQANRWKEENREWIEGWNRWIEKNGLPLAKYRMF